MGKKSLMALVSEFARLDQELIESGGEITPATEQAFDLTGEDLRAKIDKYKLYTDHLESQVNYFRHLEKEACAARRTLEKRREYLRDNLKYVMGTVLEIQELVGDDYRFTLSVPKSKLVISDESQIPDVYLKTVEVKQPNREHLLEDLMSGMTIPGARLEWTMTLRDFVNAGANARRVQEVDQ